MLVPPSSRGRRLGRARLPLVLVVLVVLLAQACDADRGAPAEQAPGGVRVASFDFVESRLLAEVYASALERAGYPVVRLPGLGPREIVAPALQQGHVDLVPEYVGSALRFYDGARPPAATSVPELQAALVDALRGRGLTALAPAPGQDQNGVVVSRTTARTRGLSAVSDLSAHADGLSFGGPPECPERPLCLGGLQDLYGLRFRTFVAFPSRAATAEALLAGQLDVGMLETVDPYLGDGRLVLLTDDLGLQPPENVVPVLRQAVVDGAGPDLLRVLDEVTATLTTAAMVGLNRAVVLEHAALPDVAADWVGSNGLGVRDERGGP